MDTYRHQTQAVKIKILVKLLIKFLMETNKEIVKKQHKRMFKILKNGFYVIFFTEAVSEENWTLQTQYKSIRFYFNT